MTPARRNLLAAAAAVMSLGLLLIGGFLANHGEAAREAAERVRAPQRVSMHDGLAVITLPAAIQRAAGIATATLTNAPQPQRLRAYASVLDLRPLTELSGQYAGAKADLDIAQANLAAARTAFARAQKLYADRQNISAAELQRADAAFHVDQAKLAAAQAALRSVTMAAEQSWGPALGRAVIDDTPPFDRLTTGRAVLLQVTLRPGQAISGVPTTAVVLRDDGGEVALAFVSPAPRTDSRLQGASYFFTAPAKSGLLPGMSVVALLPAGPAIAGVVIPRAAVVWHQGRAWAYFRTGAETLTRRPVATDLPAPGGYVVRGVADGTRVVVTGAQMLLSEEARGRAAATDEPEP